MDREAELKAVAEQRWLEARHGRLWRGACEGDEVAMGRVLALVARRFDPVWEACWTAVAQLVEVGTDG